MSQISQLDAKISKALERLKATLVVRDEKRDLKPKDGELRGRIAQLEAENASLVDEVERLRDKRDKDVAALDDLIAQLKPLIEEV